MSTILTSENTATLGVVPPSPHQQNGTMVSGFFWPFVVVRIENVETRVGSVHAMQARADFRACC